MQDCINEASVHLLRDVHDLKQTFPQHEILLIWAKNVKAISEEAVSWTAQAPDPHLTPQKLQLARVAQQHAFEQQLWALCQLFVRASSSPSNALQAH